MRLWSEIGLISVTVHDWKIVGLSVKTRSKLLLSHVGLLTV